MAILGSRERMCVHPKLVPRDGKGKVSRDINHSCRIRRRNTDKYRKYAKKAIDEVYSDSDPPQSMPGDDVGDTINDLGEGEDSIIIDGEREQNQYQSTKFKTCPYYRELSRGETASRVVNTFYPGPNVNSIDVGGETTRLGTHDIEDLVKFGTEPRLLRGVALYRREDFDGIGLSLKLKAGSIYVDQVKPNGPAAIEGSARKGDIIKYINGKSTKDWNMNRVVEEIKSSGDIILMDLFRDSTALRPSCPYYLSRALAKTAELTFAPYNYILDPSIRQTMDINISNSIIILDEAHNVESTLRESGSGDFSEVELCELLVFLNSFLYHDESVKVNIPLIGLHGADETEEEAVCELAHNLIRFIESIILLLRGYREAFETIAGTVFEMILLTILYKSMLTQ